jgi:hypothetical protein
MSSQKPFEWRKRYIIIVFLTAGVPISMINFSAYLKGHMPSIIQFSSSIFYILLWFICAWLVSDRSLGIKASSWFWGVGAVLLTVGYWGDIGFIFIPAVLLFSGPLYGLRYFIEMRSDIYLALISIAIAYGSCLLGWLLGKLKRN